MKAVIRTFQLPHRATGFTQLGGAPRHPKQSGSGTKAPKRLGRGDTTARPDPSRLLEMLQNVMAVTDGPCRVGPGCTVSRPFRRLTPIPRHPPSRRDGRASNRASCKPREWTALGVSFLWPSNVEPELLRKRCSRASATALPRIHPL
jgi:hypothetical protein